MQRCRARDHGVENQDGSFPIESSLSGLEANKTRRDRESKGPLEYAGFPKKMET